MRIEHIKLNNRVKIRRYSFGLKPKVLLLAGMHGNEKSGVFILKSLIKQLRKTNKAYLVTVIPIINPSAYAADSRVNLKDGVDMNRIFPVKNKKSESFKIAKELQNFAEQFDIIVDLHVFNKQNTLICGVDLNKNHKVQSKIRSIMERLNLDVVCRIDHRNEPKKDGSLCGYLQSKDKIALGIELPPREVLTRKQFKDILGGLVGFIQGKDFVQKNLNTYTRQQYYLKGRGDFTPIKLPGTNVSRGDVVGMLTNGRVTTPVSSPFHGKLISVSYPRFVKNKEKIFVVGKLVKGN